MIATAVSWLVALAIAWPHPEGGGRCTSDAECQLNGVCDSTAHVCSCDAAWYGAHCEYLFVLPASPVAAYRKPGTSSWGGRSWLSETDGKHHGFFSEFGGGCGMDMWDNTSRIIHAVAQGDGRAASYARVDVAVPQFAHCVDSLVLPGTPPTWLLFHNGDGQPRACGIGSPDCDQKPLEWVATCHSSNGTTPVSPPPRGHPAPPLPTGFQPANGVHVATSPDGPWRKAPAAAVDGFPYKDCPAVALHPNGSIIAWPQSIVATFGTDTGIANNYTAALSITTGGWGTSWRSVQPVVHIPRSLGNAVANESGILGYMRFGDPTMWIDARGGWHSLMQNGDGPSPCGMLNDVGLAYRDGNPLPVGCTTHMWSTDGVAWNMSSVAASNASVILASAGEVNLFRQRPKVKLNKGNNAVVAIFHGAMRCGERAVRDGKSPGNRCAESRWPEHGQSGDGGVGIVADRGLDRSFTIVVPVRSHTDTAAGGDHK